MLQSIICYCSYWVYLSRNLFRSVMLPQEELTYSGHDSHKELGNTTRSSWKCEFCIKHCSSWCNEVWRCGNLRVATCCVFEVFVNMSFPEQQHSIRLYAYPPLEMTLSVSKLGTSEQDPILVDLSELLIVLSSRIASWWRKQSIFRSTNYTPHGDS